MKRDDTAHIWRYGQSLRFRCSRKRFASMSLETKEILMNSEDLASIRTQKAYKDIVCGGRPLEIWVKPPRRWESGRGAFQSQRIGHKMTLDFKSIGAPPLRKLRDLLDHKDLGTMQNSYSGRCADPRRSAGQSFPINLAAVTSRTAVCISKSYSLPPCRVAFRSGLSICSGFGFVIARDYLSGPGHFRSV